MPTIIWLRLRNVRLITTNEKNYKYTCAMCTLNYFLCIFFLLLPLCATLFFYFLSYNFFFVSLLCVCCALDRSALDLISQIVHRYIYLYFSLFLRLSSWWVFCQNKKKDHSISIIRQSFQFKWVFITLTHLFIFLHQYTQTQNCLIS